MAEKPTLSDYTTAIKIATNKLPFDAKYDVNGDGVVNTTDAIAINKAFFGKDPGFIFADNTFLSPFAKAAEDYAAEQKAAQERQLAQEQENTRRQTLLADAQKLNGQVSADLVANNPNMNAQQLASLARRGYWSNESEAFSRVMNAMENGTAQLKQVQTGNLDEAGNPETELRMVAPDGPPGYNSLTLRATPQAGVYQFSTPNQVAGGTISGVIQADPSTGKYVPVQDYTKQIQYTPGTSGSVLGGVIGSLRDMYKSLGPIGTIIGNAVTPGLGTALSAAAAIDEGNLGGVAKGLLTGQALSQLDLGSSIVDATGSQVAGTLGESVAKGLLTGQSIDTALTNAVVNNLGKIAGSVPTSETVGPPASAAIVQETPTVTQELPSIFQDTTSVVKEAFKGSDYEDLISGQDLSADNLVGNNLTDIISQVTPEPTTVATQEPAPVIPEPVATQEVPTVTQEPTPVVTPEPPPEIPQEPIMVTQTPEDLPQPPTLDEVISSLAPAETTAITPVEVPQEPASGQDLAADSVGGNTLEDVINVLNNDTTVSGQDLSADTDTGANTLNDVSVALSSEGDAISGQDLAADATPGNTLEDVSTALTTDTTPPTKQEDTGLTPAQIANLLKFGYGLFGTTGALTKAVSSFTSPDTVSVSPDIKPFTGTYGGMNMNTPEYYQQVQQNYNRLFPTSNLNVTTPLQDWYKTQFTPVTTKLFGV